MFHAKTYPTFSAQGEIIFNFRGTISIAINGYKKGETALMKAIFPYPLIKTGYMGYRNSYLHHAFFRYH